MSKKEKQLKQYIYIVQAQLETGKCKIGITNNLNRRLKEKVDKQSRLLRSVGLVPTQLNGLRLGQKNIMV